MEIPSTEQINDDTLRHSMYSVLHKYLASYTDIIPSSDQTKEADETQKLLDSLSAIDRWVTKLGIFSVNEELDDINTKDLIYLLIPFILGELYNTLMENRHKSLETALIYWNKYLSFLENYGVLSKSEIQMWKNAGNQTAQPSLQRQQKIEAYNNIKTFKTKIETILRKLYQKNNQHLYMSINEDDELEHAFMLDLLQYAKCIILDRMTLIYKEIEILKSQPQIKALAPSKSVNPKPFIYKLNKTTQLCEPKKSIFKPYHEVPSITLAEAADWEIEVEVNTLKTDNSKCKKQNSESDSSQSACESISDTEQKEYETRAWDDWKDHNPKGWGNKMVSRG